MTHLDGCIADFMHSEVMVGCISRWLKRDGNSISTWPNAHGLVRTRNGTVLFFFSLPLADSRRANTVVRRFHCLGSCLGDLVRSALYDSSAIREVWRWRCRVFTTKRTQALVLIPVHPRDRTVEALFRAADGMWAATKKRQRPPGPNSCSPDTISGGNDWVRRQLNGHGCNTTSAPSSDAQNLSSCRRRTAVAGIAWE